MVGVAVVDIVPSLLHARDFGSVGELSEKSIFKLGGSGARDHASDVHLRVAGAGEAKINYADDFVVFVEQDIAEVEIAMDKLVLLGGLDIAMVGIDMLVVVLIVELVEKIGERILDLGWGAMEVDAA